MTARRRTIARPAAVEGVGVHLGAPCRLTYRPAPAGHGVAFRRVDLAGAPVIPALVDRAVLAERRTQLGAGEQAVHTVEHALAAVVAHQVDDLLIDVDGPEAPIMDGSARPFFDAIARAGVVAHGGTAAYLALREPVRVEDGDSAYEAYPSDDLVLDVTIDFPHPLIGRQSGRFVVTREAFSRELAAARTFGFAHEVETLRAKGLIRGASLENAVVLDERGVIGTTLRWPDEFLRHKVMDCVGDLALAGARVRARVVAVRPSHRGTVTLVRELTRVRQRGAECTV